MWNIVATVLFHRFLKATHIVAGHFYSRDQPAMNVFLRPIVDELNQLYTEGK